MGTITIDGIDYSQDEFGDWNGSDGSTFTNADFQNYASQYDQGVGYTTGQNATTVDTGYENLMPTSSGGTDSSMNWLNTIGQVLGPVAVSAATPWLNNLQSNGLLNTATGMLTTSGQALGNVQAPDLTKLIPQLRLQVMQGQMTPAQAAAAYQQASNMQNVQTDAQSLQGQRDALSRLSQIGNQQGMTEADRAALAQAMNQAAAKTASDRAAQVQQLQMQGNAGTGTELAARLSGIQGGANANALAGASNAQAAQARALQAIQAGLQGNAALNTQQFQQAAQKAQAQDVINQFNTTAQNTMNQANAGYTQAANLNNFNTANQIAGTNVGIQNTQAMLPYKAVQENYNNQLGLGKAQTGAQLSAGTALGKMATDQIARSSGAGAGTAAAGGQSTAGTGATGSIGNVLGTAAGSAGSSLGNAIGTGIINNAGSIYDAAGDVLSGAGDFVGGAVDTAGDWLSGAGNAIADWFSDDNLKTNKREMTDSDIDNLMAQMTAYKYRYKGNKNPDQVGVLAQDMEKGGSNSVINTPAGKKVQGTPALGEALAVLANQHERIKRLEGKN